MQKPQIFFEQIQQNRSLTIFFALVAVFEIQLCRFDIPIAEFVPKLFHERGGRVIVAVAVQCFARGFRGFVQARVNPFVKFS